MSAEPTPLSRVTRVAATRIPTRHAEFTALAYRDEHTGEDHVALVLGDLDGLGRRDDDDNTGDDTGDDTVSMTVEAPLVRLHSECLTGDSLGSQRCDCRDQLDAAQAAIAEEGRGAVIYLRGHEGRGIGLAAKLRAYELQDRGLDTLDANVALGLPVDAREYGAAAAILRDLGVSSLRLLSNNPAKERGLRDEGVEVRREGLGVPARPENARYLRTKRERMGHHRAADAVEHAWTMLLAGQVPPAGDLAEQYGPIVEAGDRLVLAQLGQSLDGFIAARSGDACYVTGTEDRTHLHRLRALVDAVVVGVGTVAADDCRLTVRSVRGENPVRVILDPSARAPRDAHLLTDPEAPTLWLVADDTTPPDTTTPSHVEVAQLPRRGGDGGFATRDVLDVLDAHGLGRVLVEGGGVTVSRFLAEGSLDRLLVTTAPVLVGDGVPGLRFDGQEKLADAMRAPTRRFALGADICVELDLAAARAGNVKPGQRSHITGDGLRVRR